MHGSLHVLAPSKARMMGAAVQPGRVLGSTCVGHLAQLCLSSCKDTFWEHMGFEGHMCAGHTCNCQCKRQIQPGWCFRWFAHGAAL